MGDDAHFFRIREAAWRSELEKIGLQAVRERLSSDRIRGRGDGATCEWLSAPSDVLGEWDQYLRARDDGGALDGFHIIHLRPDIGFIQAWVREQDAANARAAELKERTAADLATKRHRSMMRVGFWGAIAATLAVLVSEPVASWGSALFSWLAATFGG